MPTYVLTDTSRDLYVESFALEPAGGPGRVSVAKSRLRGGRRDGVDLIRVDNGALAFSVVPTRGMGLWKARYHADAVAWDSPVTDGPVHPSLVNLAASGGIGWLDGFDELMVRCGLENNGAPYQERAGNRDVIHPLHGRIANLPAHYVAVHVDETTKAVTIEGHVLESKLFHIQVRLVTRITTEPGSNRLTVRDEVFNLRDQPSEVQLLYHWNFGPPHLDEGAQFAAPAREVCPRDARAQEGLGHFDIYQGPEPGFAEQAYFFALHGQGNDGKTLAMLRNRAGDKAVALRFSTRQLPCFTLWKSTGALKEGYVTGLEPATNYPNPRPFEKEHGRVVAIPPGGSYVVETVLEVFDTAEAVARVETEVQRLQAQAVPVIHKAPAAPFTSAG